MIDYYLFAKMDERSSTAQIFTMYKLDSMSNNETQHISTYPLSKYAWLNNLARIPNASDCYVSQNPLHWSHWPATAVENMQTQFISSFFAQQIMPKNLRV